VGFFAMDPRAAAVPAAAMHPLLGSAAQELRPTAAWGVSVGGGRQFSQE